MKLKDKVALVTGGGRGIGRAIAEGLAREGATVAINYSQSKEGALAAVEAIRANQGKAMVIQADVSSEPAAQAMVSQVVESYGGIDILVNNAGVNLTKPFTETTEEEWDRVIDVNQKGTFFCTQIVGEQMVRQIRDKILGNA